MGLRWLRLCYFAEGRKIAQVQSPRDHSFNPETRMKAVYICFIYGIHIFIVYWLVKRFLEKSRNFIVNIIMIILIVFDWCIQHVQCAQIGAFIAHRSCVKPNRAITAQIIYALEKTIYGLKKTIYSLKRLFTGWKRLRLWPGFFRIVSLFLITWRTFNQSMNKNIWMLYIITNPVVSIPLL